MDHDNVMDCRLFTVHVLSTTEDVDLYEINELYEFVVKPVVKVLRNCNLKFGFEAPNSITVNGSESDNISILPVDGINLKEYTVIGGEVANGAVAF